MQTAIINNGIVTNVCVGQATPHGAEIAIDVTSVSPRPGPGWSYDGVHFAPPPAIASVRVLTPLQFLNRFPVAKLAAMYAAASTNPMITVLDRKITTAQNVSLDDQETIDSLAYLVSQNYLTADDVSTILA